MESIMRNVNRLQIVAGALLVASATWMLSVPQAQAAEAKSEPATGEDRMQFARGAKSSSENCGMCHNIRDPKELRDDQWRAAVAHMRVRANLTGQETRDVLAFLQESN